MSVVTLDETRVISVLEKLPDEIKTAYFAWRRIILAEGFNGLRTVKGFRFKKLKGQRAEQYSCRLNRAYRVIFMQGYVGVIVIVLEVNKHEY